MPEEENDASQTGWSLKAIPALIGAFALLALPFAAAMALGSGMLLDAPGSERNPLTWMQAALILVSPLALVATIVLAAQTILSFTSRRFNLLILVPAIWWIAYLTVEAVAEVFCEGRTVCA